MKSGMIKKEFVIGILLLYGIVSIVSALNATPSFSMKPMNQPPNIPSNPTPKNQATDVLVTTELFWAGGDPDGDPVTYTIYFGTTSTPLKVKTNQSTLSYDPPGTLAYNTKYYWKIVAWDNHNLSTEGSVWSFTTNEAANTPPNKPSKPLGIINVEINVEYAFITGTVDPNGDVVYYLWDWGDGNDSEWLGSYHSGALCEGRHIWTTKDNCTIRVKAKDIYGTESEWSDPLPITVPYSCSNPLSQFFELLFQRFSGTFLLIWHVLGY
jgi:hypothetical protein